MPSMKLAHAVLAQDLGSVKSLCQEKVINMGFRNLGDHGASILYYAVRSDNLAIVKELLANRVKADVTMEDSHGVDISMILAAIFNHPSLSREVVRVVCEHIAYLHTLYYKGHNCMMAAIDNDVSLPICQELLSCGGPSLLCDRSQANLTPRDYSEKQGKSQYIHVIDNLVYDWVTQPTKHPGKRSQLPMLGYNHIRHATSMEGVSVEDFAKSSPDVQKYLEEIDKVQERIARLALFLQRGDTIKFKQQFCDVSLLARRRGDGLPLLHAAVLNRQYEIVEYMIFHKDEHLHVDEVRDLTGRTALHYACAMEGVKHIEYLLSEQGACEYIVDKRGFMPVDFRERRGTNAMLTLLQRQIERDYGTPEPNPWQVQKRRSAPSPFSAMPLLMHPLINPHVHPHPSHPLNLHGYGAMGALGPMGATYVDSVSEDQVSYTKGSHQNLRKAKSKAGSSCRVM
ncbi:PREDICTED: uncharacterized protein LOC106807518 [Priapulus caudatus]|uniref:Uncharacterized protein LOC106807518 n=1 Tax=Priapulus caudatus TaxID=37621 RepID=A0ABM1DZI5_PRICU|nr:PREDICTED: uncharacterized protein LOC106807518 [Priapulus caudatus]